MHRVTYQRLVDGAQLERATTDYATAGLARRAARRAIERVRPGATIQAWTRDGFGVAWTPRSRQTADTVWRDPYDRWPERVTWQLTRSARLTGDQTAVEVTRVTLEPADDANHASE